MCDTEQITGARDTWRLRSGNQTRLDPVAGTGTGKAFPGWPHFGQDKSARQMLKDYRFDDFSVPWS